MSRYKIRDQKSTYFLTLTVVGWIDAFTRKRHRDILINSLKYCQKHKGLVVYAYVIMSNHVHLIAASRNKIRGLSDIIRDFKSFSAKEILKTIEAKERMGIRRDWMLYLFKYFAKGRKLRNRTFQFWQDDYHAFELWSPRMINQKIAYIHLNPVKAGIVKCPQHYIYSSASNYYNDTGILEVEVIPPLSEIGYLSL